MPSWLAGVFGISMRISVHVSHVLECLWFVPCSRITQWDALQEKEIPLIMHICIKEFLLLQGRLHVHTGRWIFLQCMN